MVVLQPPDQDLGKAIIVSIIAGAVFYAAVMFALSLCMPWKQSIQFPMPTADVFRAAFGYEWAARLVLFAAFLGLVTSLNGKFLASCRVLEREIASTIRAGVVRLENADDLEGRVVLSDG